MEIKKPFKIFSWRKPFLPALKDYVDSVAPDGRATILVPNNRPRRYFLDLYAKERKPALVPGMFTISDAQALWRDYSRNKPERVLSRLDQAALLYQCVKTIASENYALEKTFAEMDYERFLPWGFRLADLLEEMFLEGVKPKNLAVSEEEVGKTAAPLLNSLSRIAEEWLVALADGFTTPGLEAARAAEAAANIPAILDPAAGKEVFVAGFYSLNGVEKKLIRSLWERGARICLHTDPGIIENAAQWAADEHQAWLKKWGARAELIGEAGDGDPVSFFYSGYDVHSQLKEFKKRIADETGNSAILLTQPGLLMPTLHHLPDKNVNISMGYPLNRGSFANLLDTIFALKFSRDKSGDYYWRDLLKLIKHPYTRSLAAEDGESLQNAFQLMEERILESCKYVNLNGFYNNARLTFSPEQIIVLDKWKKIIFDGIQPRMTLGAFASALEELFDLFKTYGGDLWNSSTIDAKVMERIQNKIIPALKDSLLAGEEFDLSAHYAIITDALKNERAAFRADPLMGTQILGLLETRLLQFDKLYILDATEDVLPGQGESNELLPDSLRGMLRLPDASSREKFIAHNLTRLCACAKEVNYFWQESVAPSALTGEKKFRSRFVEERIWKEELKAGRVFIPGEAPLLAAKSSAGLNPVKYLAIDKTAKIDRAIRRFLNNAISPTALDTYLSCPLRFANRYLFNIRAAKEVNEEEDSALIGECVHKILENVFAPRVGQTFTPGELSWEEVSRELAAQIEAYRLQDKLPMSAWLYFDIVAPMKLKTFLKEQPESTKIVSLENELSSEFNAGGEILKFRGRIDRMDERAGKIHVLDYKTGYIPAYEKGVWTRHEFFEELKTYLSPDAGLDERADELLGEIRDAMGSLQLPLYIVMLKRSGYEAGDAAFVDLSKSGKEIGLFDGLSDTEKSLAIEHCETVLAFVVSHMLKSLKIRATENKKCKYCDYGALCKA
ncbi:MAG: PD-(D/E)XK nuclease family protein [Desulfovibrio sp.]|nr:PD-(D/E)XK nuclease family protein [Desulfovibrio sp.]